MHTYLLAIPLFLYLFYHISYYLDVSFVTLLAIYIIKIEVELGSYLHVGYVYHA